jgi:hypothetical protein
MSNVQESQPAAAPGMPVKTASSAATAKRLDEAPALVTDSAHASHIIQ